MSESGKEEENEEQVENKEELVEKSEADVQNKDGEVGDKGEDSSLHISGLTRNVKKDHIKEIFGTYGEVLLVEISTQANGPKRTNTATITFSKDRDAEQAMFYMDGGQIDGNIIKVSFVLVKKSQNQEDEEPPSKNPDVRGRDERNRNFNNNNNRGPDRHPNDRFGRGGGPDNRPGRDRNDYPDNNYRRPIGMI
jgi:RNA-binding protein with serine-rich domain 1